MLRLRSASDCHKRYGMNHLTMLILSFFAECETCPERFYCDLHWSQAHQRKVHHVRFQNRLSVLIVSFQSAKNHAFRSVSAPEKQSYQAERLGIEKLSESVVNVWDKLSVTQAKQSRHPRVLVLVDDHESSKLALDAAARWVKSGGFSIVITKFGRICV